MNTLLVFRKAGVNVVDVFYKGASPEKLVALLGGHVSVATMVYGGVRDHVKAGDGDG